MIIVFGAVGIDIVTRLPRFPRPGETIACDGFDVVPGTKGANQSLAAARAGASVVHVGTVGRDEAGAVAVSLLRAAGVDLSRVQEVDTPTGTCLITVDATGENTVVAAASANRQTTVSQLDGCAFGAGDTLIVQCELPMAETIAAIRLAKARGTRVVLNAAPATAVPDDILSMLDLLVVNETEAEAIAAASDLDGTDPAMLAQSIHAAHGCATVVTLGAGGAILWERGVRHHVAAPEVTVVDTTAAGDSFTGYIAAALDRGLGMQVALRHGVFAGSICCTRHGAQTGIPSLHEVAAAIGAAST